MQIHALSDEANRQLRQMFRDFYAQYVAPHTLRKRWQGRGGAGCQTKLVKTLAESGANRLVECAQYTGAIGGETANGETVVCYVRGDAVGNNKWGYANPICAVAGSTEGGYTSSISVDSDHPSGVVGPADHEFVPLECT